MNVEMSWFVRSPEDNPLLQPWLNLPFVGQQTPAAPGMPIPGLAQGDQFSILEGLSPELAEFTAGHAGAEIDPSLMWSQLMGLPESGRDLGPLSGIDGVEDMSREELESAIKDLFAELYADGTPLEGRPDSDIQHALATGDFSGLSAEDLISLFTLLDQYRQNQNNPGPVASQPHASVAPQGSWGPGGTNSYGGGGQHTGTNRSAPAPSGPAPVGPPPPGSSAGEALAHTAEQVANGMGTTGWCYRGVKQAVAQSTGVQLTGGSAYEAADQLAASGRFQEVEVSPENLTQLPPGAVVVWGQTSASPHGHISVALGDGREASDHVQSQITSLRGASNYRVFVPTDA
ncbi:MAG: hypothetical protein RKU31_18105 [Deltaproteobacteria bacterium]|jgi:hypothetical protein